MVLKRKSKPYTVNSPFFCAANKTADTLTGLPAVCFCGSLSKVGVDPKMETVGIVEHVQDTIAKASEAAVTISIAFQNLNLVVNPFGKAVRIRTAERI
jgi:hypothetical protein